MKNLKSKTIEGHNIKGGTSGKGKRYVSETLRRKEGKAIA